MLSRISSQPTWRIALAFPLIALACGGVIDWEAFLSHGRCGEFSRLDFVGPVDWAVLATAWCMPALPLLFRPDQARRQFYALEAAAMAVPVAGLAVLLAMPDAVGCNEWSALSVGVLIVPLLLVHMLVVGVGLAVLAGLARRR